MQKLENSNYDSENSLDEIMLFSYGRGVYQIKPSDVNFYTISLKKSKMKTCQEKNSPKEYFFVIRNR